MSQRPDNLINKAWNLAIEQGYSRRSVAAKLGVPEGRIDKILNALHARKKRQTPPANKRKGIPRIVLLEDDPLAADAVEHMLSASGLEAQVIHAAGRETFLSALETGEVDVVVSDSAVPDIKPLGALHLVKQRYPAAAFFILAARENSIDERLATRSGVLGCVEKRQMGRLIPLIREAIDRRVQWSTKTSRRV